MMRTAVPWTVLGWTVERTAARSVPRIAYDTWISGIPLIFFNSIPVPPTHVWNTFNRSVRALIATVPLLQS